MGEPGMEQVDESAIKDVLLPITSSLQLYPPDPADEFEVDIIFFHGLQLKQESEVNLSTWRSGDHAQELWPQLWLPRMYPKARIMVASYDASISRTATQGRVDVFLICESLLQDILIARRRQGRQCPVILVGHSFGGLIIKELCVQAHAKKDTEDYDSQFFIERIRGIVFYSTPHSGMNDEILHELVVGSIVTNKRLLSFVKALSTNAARLHHEFCRIQKGYSWKISGLGETVAVEGTSDVLVPEASSRFGDVYSVVDGCDHFSICKPTSKECNSYQYLVQLIDAVYDTQKKSRKRANMATVGIDPLVKDMVAYLRNNVFLGLFGMGGVGKTTLAKRVFEEIADEFEYACFVEDFKLISGDREKVKEKVWGRMQHNGKPVPLRNVDWFQVAGKKLLLVLDDIETQEHIQFLRRTVEDNDMEDSRFLMTSRNVELLSRLQVFRSTRLCEVPFLKDEDAVRLFRKFAFRTGEEPTEWMEDIMQEIVRGCGGLPLTLEVLGTYLYRFRDEHIWKELPAALRAAEALPCLQDRVWAKLRVSYDSLQIEEKNVFLDLACSFIRDMKLTSERTKHIFSSRCTSINNILQSLEDKCLVKKTEKDDSSIWHPEGICFEVRMHEHLRSMGEKIARDEEIIYLFHTLSDPGEGLQNLLSDTHSCQKIVSFQVAESVSSSLPRCRDGQSCILRTIQQALPKMSSLQYLKLELISTPCNLGCLRMGGLSLPSNVVLVLLEVHSWQLDLNWGSQGLGKLSLMKIRMWDSLPLNLFSPATCASLRALKCLELDMDQWDGVEDGHSTPIAFEKLRNLQELYISCPFNYSPVRLPDTIGLLSQLRKLDIQKVNFRELPQTFGDLKELVYMRIGGCGQLFRLPMNFGDLSKLESLEMGSLGSLSKLQHLPMSIGNLRSLKRLVMWWMDRLEDLPETFGHLSKLEILVISGSVDSKLRELPDTFGNLSRLRHLRLYCSDLRNLPPTFGNLSRLQHLSLRCDFLDNLPRTFGNLSSLEHLELSLFEWDLESLPETFANLSSLEYLALGTFWSRQRFPEVIGKLSKLKTLVLRIRKELVANSPITIEELHSHKRNEFLIREVFSNPSDVPPCTVRIGLA